MTSFALIGAGGLGGPVAYALAAAGARSITVCDPDLVDLGNLQRQVQFTTADVGRPKVEALADELGRRGFARTAIRALPVRFAADTADLGLAGAEVAVEGSDDPATKFALNDLALARRLPFAIGGVERQAGQVFRGRPGAACYRCLFEAPPGDSDPAPGCADAGVLGAAV
ncbi:MAG TPA: ThiF family adenylyltransferase, partial [Kofleriaceae bacterium]|nr:ThiF family adenylyltransferase [Kofleriaceae bacterium]